ncbi:MAG: AbrB/MazE/SpoVT family DNA-binding domain-containing protein [Candidatus Altiarchaeota archaeon]|nr:AbrB/MazE/SpoVT family DNA-binding domain-containing protein [Candidatus Altiarchaeota archaeon]
MKKPLESDVTKISSKGQLIIPVKIRQKLKIKDGNVFAVSAVDNMVVLKKIDTSINADDLKTLRAVEKAWEDLEDGKYRALSKTKFLEEIKIW